MPWKNQQYYGRFKNVLLPISELPKEAAILSPELIKIQTALHNGSIAEGFACLQIITLYLNYRYAYYRKKSIPTLTKENASEFLKKRSLYGIPECINISLYNWINNVWNLKLIDYNPSSYQMAEAQSKGFRYCTISWENSFLGDLVDNKRDACEHLLHDLAHVYTFFQEKYDPLSQMTFYKNLIYSYNQFDKLCKEDPIYAEKFDYCLSDMNSHPEHLLSYLKAITIEFFLRRENKTLYEPLSELGQENWEQFKSSVLVFGFFN